MFSMFDELNKKNALNTFQEPYNEKSFKKIKRFKSLQKAEVYLEPMGLNDFIFSQYKLRHRSLLGYI